MSAHKFRLILTDPAKDDLRSIVNYTCETWGERQASVYHSKIQKALGLIMENPHNGKETLYGLRMVLAEKHKIFYSIEPQKIIVIRILHQRMDEGRHLQ